MQLYTMDFQPLFSAGIFQPTAEIASGKDFDDAKGQV